MRLTKIHKEILITMWNKDYPIETICDVLKCDKKEVMKKIYNLRFNGHPYLKLPKDRKIFSTNPA